IWQRRSRVSLRSTQATSYKHSRRPLLSFLTAAGATQGVGERAAALFLATPWGRTARRRTRALAARRGCVAAAGSRGALVVEPQRQRDAFARLVDLQDLDADDVAGLHDLARILDEVL